ncbi:MAPEG family protein [Pseudosulfitobacter sp. SM2401]|uniref:MAPEG family protein n=1 Tax=Pseudosulfitobacter sp. SM2401 TaxID=3350098 RepID=UPI002A264EB8|nr:MAPEG family protein [Ascidiaceihabitans sp.]
MSVELSYLAMYGTFTLILLVVQASLGALQHGIPAFAGNRDGLVSTGMAARADRALNNSVVALALIAPAIVIVAMTDQATSGTELSVRLFLGARVVYAIVYIVGIPYVRTAAWVVGFLATACVYCAAL